MVCTVEKPHVRPFRATMPQVAELFDMDRSSIFEMAAAGRLPFPTFKVGRRVFGSRHHLEELLGVEAVSAVLDRQHGEAIGAA